MLLLYRDARSTDSDFNHVKVILDTLPLDWSTMHNTYGVPANASGDTTVTFVSYDSGTTGYRRCYFGSNNTVHTSYMPSNTVYFDESDGTFYIFPTGTTRKRTNPYVPFLNTAGEQIDIHEFTYSAKRMGDTPQITANFYDYDCYDKKWNIDDNNGKKVQRYSNVFTIFNGERYYLKSTPTSVFENTDARYKHSLVFLSERDVFEHVLMFDTVPKMYSTFLTTMTYHSGDVVRYNGLYYEFTTTHTGEWDYDDVEQITVFENALAESTQFSFYGNIIELAKRINASLVASEVSTFNSSNQTYDGYHIDLLVYDEFSTTKNYNIDDVVRYRESLSDDWGYYQFTQVHNAGAWNSSQVKTYELPETVITFDNNTLKEALGFIESEFGLSYYFDQKVIYIRSYQSEIGSTSDPIVYGEDYDDALLSINRNNKTQDVINRMTALGSEDNIPYYYPNPTEEGWLEPRYNGQESAQLVAYTDTEAYLKNRMATAFVYGYQFGVYPTSFKNWAGVTVQSPQYGYIACTIGGVSTKRRFVKMRFKQECDEPFRLYMTDSLFTWTGQSSINSSLKRNKYGGVKFEKNDTNDTTNYDTFYTATYIDINYVNANTGKYTADFFVYQYIETYYFNGNQSTSRIGFRQPITSEQVDPWRPTGSHHRCDLTWYDRFYPLPPVRAMYVHLVRGLASTLDRYVPLSFYCAGIMSAVSWGSWPSKVEAIICDDETWSGDYGTYYSNKQTPLPFSSGSYYVDISDGADGTDDVRHRVYRCGNDNSTYDSKQGNKFLLNAGSTTYYYEATPSASGYASKFGNRLYNTNDIRQLFSLSEFKYNLPHWYLRTEVVDLSAYGIAYNGTPALLDQITFVQVRYLTPQSHLMPALYFKTNGDRRFYNATQYPIVVGTSGRTPDTDAGEEWNGNLHTEIVNKLYKNGDTNTYMMVENPYEVGKPHEHIEEFEDIKPTIKDVKVNNLRIDVIDRIEFDQYDNDELKQLGGDSSDVLAYKHPYFYVKLRPLGFNLFDLAIDEAEILVEFTTGSCGSCSFQIAVGEKFKENCVCIWEYNAYKYNGQLKYAAGDLMRYDNEQLYKDTGHAQEITGLGIATLPADGSRTWGDVKWKDVVRSNVAASQRDTTTNYVWIALKKDVDTFGTIMPTRINGLVPKSVNGDEDGNMTSGSVVIGTGDQDTADRFVLTHIRLPQAYVRAAEEELSKELVRYMVEHNMEDFSFTIKFSRIYFAEHQTVQNTLNENSLIHIVYANHGIIDVLVSSFQYKVVGKDALPEISVELQDKLTQINWRTIQRRNRRIIPNPWVTPVVRREDVEAERWLARIASRVRLLNEESNTNGMSLALLEERFHLNIEELSKLQSNSIKEIANTDEKIVRLNSSLGFSEFDETKEYQVGDYVVYKNRIYKFKVNHTGGSWMGSDEVDDSTNTDMVFKALGYQEFSESTSYAKDDIVYKNNRLVKFTAAKTAGAWDEEKVTSASVKIEDSISRNAANAADLKASNIITDLGFQLFDPTRSYSENEIVVYNNRLYRFTTSKSIGSWDVSKVALDSVANCVFRSLGLEEYNSSSTQTIRRGTSFFKNGKAFVATQDFVPSQVGVDVSRVTNPYNVVSMTATESDTKALSQTVEVLRQTVSSLNSQILDKDNGLATIVRGVNSTLATLTYDMATLADTLKANEHLAQDESVINAATAVSTSANAANTELTGADDSSVYNKMADVYSKDVFGERISVVRTQFSTEDASFKFTKMVYDTSHYMTTQDTTFVEFSTEVSYEVKDRVIYNKHLYEFTSSHEAGSWNPSDVTNVDDILLKAVFFATDRYSETSGNIFLTKGRFIDTNAFCNYVYETVIKSGEAGILYTDLKDIVEAASKDYDDIYDGSAKNMITDHVWTVGGYTVLQFTSLRLEYNDRIYVAATYKDDYTRDDNRHILFDIKYINEMSEKLQKFFIETDKEVEYDGQMYYYMPRVDLANNLGDNYLYCADSQVDDGTMMFVAELPAVGEQNCYLLPKE